MSLNLEKINKIKQHRRDTVFGFIRELQSLLFSVNDPDIPKGIVFICLLFYGNQLYQCWNCSYCKTINKLQWTLTKFMMKCYICRQNEYAPTVKIFDSNEYVIPTNDYWECKKCTLQNTIGINECEACFTLQTYYHQYPSQSDDESNGDGQFLQVYESDDDDDNMGGIGGMGGMRGMGGMGGIEQLFGGMMGMGGMGGMMRRHRKERNTKPFDKIKEANLSTLLINGFIRNCVQYSIQIDTKIYDAVNCYYIAFDRWDWNLFEGNWTSKQNDIVTIKRSKKDNAIWKNMYGLQHIKFDRSTNKSTIFSWKLRLLDRMQINKVIISTPSREEDELEIEYMDVIIGVVNVDKMQTSISLKKSFNLYSTGWGMFAGNGKIYKNGEWIPICQPLKHKDLITVNLEWMKRAKYNKIYGLDGGIGDNSINNNDEFVVALTFQKNDEINDISKDAVFCLPALYSYKLSVSSAKKRFEIEWISSNWVGGHIDDDIN